MSFKNALIGNWRTSGTGLLLSVIQAYSGGMSWKAIGLALPTLLFGVVAKDSAVGSKAVE